jgi:hypothetical protein
MFYQEAMDSIPESGCLHGADYMVPFHMFNNFCTNSPKFYDCDLAGVPFYAFFYDFTGHQFVNSFLTNSTVKYHLQTIFSAYGEMTKSPLSRGYMHKGEGGWFSPAACKRVNYD